MMAMKMNSVYDEKSSFASTTSARAFCFSLLLDTISLSRGKKKDYFLCLKKERAPFLRPSLVRTFVRAAISFRTPRRFRVVVVLLLLGGPVSKHYFISFSVYRPFLYPPSREAFFSTSRGASSPRANGKKERERERKKENLLLLLLLLLLSSARSCILSFARARSRRRRV